MGSGIDKSPVECSQVNVPLFGVLHGVKYLYTSAAVCAFGNQAGPLCGGITDHLMGKHDTGIVAPCFPKQIIIVGIFRCRSNSDDAGNL